MSNQTNPYCQKVIPDDQPVKQTQREIDEIFAPDTLKYSRIESNTGAWKVVTSTLERSDGSTSQFQKIIAK